LPAIVREVERIVAAGFKEIALTGVHLGSYGRDLTPPSSLTELLSTLVTRVERRWPGSVLFRVSSLEPMDCTPEIVELIASSSALAPHVHLPLQHASNRVLRAMRRPYTLEEYRSLVDGIRDRLPHASIGSDVIVGFPGERDEDIETLASYLAESPLTHVHVFPYSDRPGTDATALAGKVSGSVVRERARLIREIATRRTTTFRRSQIGAVHRGLTLEDGTLVVTENYLKVRIPSGHTRNEWVQVRLTGLDELLRGEVLTSSR
jgi:threonylcarbamoyladenosine tRNA methylthiotransferase MtaB